MKFESTTKKDAAVIGNTNRMCHAHRRTMDSVTLAALSQRIQPSPDFCLNLCCTSDVEDCHSEATCVTGPEIPDGMPGAKNQS